LLFKTAVYAKFFSINSPFSTGNAGASTHNLVFFDWWILEGLSSKKRKIFKEMVFLYGMFGWFKRKKEAEELKDATRKGFEDVKKDISSVSGWIKHLDSEKNLQQKELEGIKKFLATIEKEIEGIKNVLSIMNDLKTNSLFKTPKAVSDKQTAVYAVQTGVQTAVQTPNLDLFSVTERAIVWLLLNSDMKLSYDDLAAMLGKERSTIRGQLNRIKHKSEIIKEIIEKNGKKRIFIPEEIKEKLLKKAKVRIKTSKNSKKNTKNN